MSWGVIALRARRFVIVLFDFYQSKLGRGGENA